MIQTTMQDLFRYASINPYFKIAFEALQQISQEEFAKGRHPVDEERVFVNALEYQTKAEEQSVMEAHRAYIDVMYMLSGEETLGCYPTAKLSEITGAYDTAGDALLAKMEEDCTKLTMHPGDVVIFFPEDAHAPGMDLNGSHTVRKLIAKVAVSETA